MCGPTHRSSSASKPRSESQEPAEKPSICLLTREGRQILTQHQASTNKPLFQEAFPSPSLASQKQISEAPPPETQTHTKTPTQPPSSLDRHQAKRQRRKEARNRGHRLYTVCGRWRNGSRFPDLRMTGLWLEKAGFGLGQEAEVEIEEGKLTIQTV